ncbi:DUF6318 family protein [Nocardioides sp.]|uniref:DUF6318 family protein n=1 Tax=Nocardioides sp. TaxID=35761 RepID=UPI0026136E31|nr:DUF6318 family protein [Nocardioides sp.]MDI6911311.1 DUF6318 family protein [Nocardioides sp.]
MIVAVTRSRTVIAALCVVSVLALGACSGDDPEPRFAPPSTSAPTSPSTTAVSGPVEPTMPAAAKGSDAAAAEAFVRFYWEMVNYAQATGDVAGLKALATRCINCDNGIDFITNAYDKGGQIRGGDGTVSRLETHFVKRTDGWWAITECHVALTEQVVDLPGDAHDEHYGGGSSDIRLYLQPIADGWTIRSVATQ